MKLFISGPMRGYPLYNFPAFNEAEARLRRLGHEVFSPAAMDRETGFDEKVLHTEDEMRRLLPESIARDVASLVTCEGIVLLSGWEQSAGSAIEIAVANLLGLAILDATTGGPLANTVLDEAKRLVYGQRGAAYGHPLADFTRTASIWSAILGYHVSAEQAVLCMIGLKISREANQPKRDNRVDIAGYAECLERIQQQRAEA